MQCNFILLSKSEAANRAVGRSENPSWGGGGGEQVLRNPRHIHRAYFGLFLAKIWGGGNLPPHPCLHQVPTALMCKGEGAVVMQCFDDQVS